MAVTTTQLENLQEALLTEFNRKLAEGTATAADLSTIAKFLKDNHIEVKDDHPKVTPLMRNLPVSEEEIERDLAEAG